MSPPSPLVLLPMLQSITSLQFITSKGLFLARLPRWHLSVKLASTLRIFYAQKLAKKWYCQLWYCQLLNHLGDKINDNVDWLHSLIELTLCSTCDLFKIQFLSKYWKEVMIWQKFIMYRDFSSFCAFLYRTCSKVHRNLRIMIC